MELNVDEAAALPETIKLEDFSAISTRCSKVVEKVRDTMLKPNKVKKSPMFQTPQLAALTGLDDVKKVDYLAKRGDLPPGQIPPSSKRRVFTVSEVREWTRRLRSHKLRPEGAEALTVSIVNFKGGVTKTTTAVTLAQGLALRGHKVLLIDADPQASATTLFGIIPELEVPEEKTLLPLFRGDEETIEDSIRPTYWEGIDLVPGMNDLFAAEFELPARQMSLKSFQFWNVLHNGIDNARLKYDVIIVDTPPALSYITINALMAADGLVMPLPPSSLDFLSSSMFWGLASSLTSGLKKHGAEKEFEFIDILPSKVDPEDPAVPLVKKWMAGAYQDKVVGVEIPKTVTAATASAEFGTVYDQPRKQVTITYDRFVEHVEQQLNFGWRRQVSRLNQAGNVNPLAAGVSDVEQGVSA